jgi:hypothetical protein
MYSGDNVGVDKAPAIEEGRHHLFGVVRLDSGLDGVWLPILYLLF